MIDTIKSRDDVTTLFFSTLPEKMFGNVRDGTGKCRQLAEAIAEFIREQVVYDEENKKCHARVVFKDKSFADTNVKTNAIQVLKQFDIDEVVSV